MAPSGSLHAHLIEQRDYQRSRSYQHRASRDEKLRSCPFTRHIGRYSCIELDSTRLPRPLSPSRDLFFRVTLAGRTLALVPRGKHIVSAVVTSTTKKLRSRRSLLTRKLSRRFTRRFHRSLHPLDIRYILHGFDERNYGNNRSLYLAIHRHSFPSLLFVGNGKGITIASSLANSETFPSFFPVVTSSRYTRGT